MRQQIGVRSMISMIAVLGAETRFIGRNGGLIWKIPEDMAHFKERTEGHPVVMGNRTQASIPRRFWPLSNRTNIVLTRHPVFLGPNVIVTSSINEAFRVARESPGHEETFVMGGGEIYNIAIAFATRLYLTLVHSNEEGDVRFPPYGCEFTRVIERRESSHGDLRYTFLTLER